MKQPVCALEHSARTRKARARHQGGAQARLRGPAGMHALGPRSFSQVLDDAARHAARDAERVDGLLVVQLQRHRNTGRRAHRAEHRGWMEARFVHGFRHDHAQSAEHFHADRDAAQRRRTIRIVPLADGKYGRHHDRADMHGPALERVVEILAMRGGAVHESGAGRTQRALVPDRRAGAVVVAARQCAFDVVLIARGDA